jgi:hypothetical protein
MLLSIMAFLIFLAFLVMFIVTFVYVLKIWNFLQEALRSGSFPALDLYRVKQEARSMLEGYLVFAPGRAEEIARFLSGYPEDKEAASLTERLKAKNEL